MTINKETGYKMCEEIYACGIDSKTYPRTYKCCGRPVDSADTRGCWVGFHSTTYAYAIPHLALPEQHTYGNMPERSMCTSENVGRENTERRILHAFYLGYTYSADKEDFVMSHEPLYLISRRNEQPDDIEDLLNAIRGSDAYDALKHGVTPKQQEPTAPPASPPVFTPPALPKPPTPKAEEKLDTDRVSGIGLLKSKQESMMKMNKESVNNANDKRELIYNLSKLLKRAEIDPGYRTIIATQKQTEKIRSLLETMNSVTAEPQTIEAGPPDFRAFKIIEYLETVIKKGEEKRQESLKTKEEEETRARSEAERRETERKQLIPEAKKVGKAFPDSLAEAFKSGYFKDKEPQKPIDRGLAHARIFSDPRVGKLAPLSVGALNEFKIEGNALADTIGLNKQKIDEFEGKKKALYEELFKELTK
jgi:hypothetical protein